MKKWSLLTLMLGTLTAMNISGGNIFVVCAGGAEVGLDHLLGTRYQAPSAEYK